jgi:hypothetical protein
MGRKFNPGGIRIEGPDDYVDEVYDILDQQINRNPAGKIILAWIDDNPRYITIVPNGHKCNSSTPPDNPDDASPEGEHYYLSHNFYTDGDGFKKSSTLGTGRGSDAHIEFTPGVWGKDCFPKPVYASKPDVVLFHELIHALRENQGFFNPIPMPKTDCQDQEEFLAITAENVYISAKCKCETGIRSYNYLTIDEYTSPLAGSAAVSSPPPLSVVFLADHDYREAMKTLSFWPPVYGSTFGGIAWIQEAVAPYNPFREFTVNMAKYMLLRPDFDYIAQYNHLVEQLEQRVSDLKNHSLSLSERDRLNAEKADLEGKIKRWPDSDNKSP